MSISFRKYRSTDKFYDETVGYTVWSYLGPIATGLSLPTTFRATSLCEMHDGSEFDVNFDKAIAEDPKNLFIAAMQHSVIVGVALFVDHGLYIELRALCVAKHLRSKGLPMSLLKDGLRRAKSRWTNRTIIGQGNVALYKKCKFRKMTTKESQIIGLNIEEGIPMILK